MRSVLTILGIIIGVAAVITLVTVGKGTTAQVTQQIANMGTNVLMITQGKRMGPGQRSSAPAFDIRDVEAISRDINSLNGVAPVSMSPVTAVVGNQNWSTSVTGSNNDFFAVRNWTIASGRIFEPAELRAGQAVCVIGPTVNEKLFNNQDPVGMNIRLGTVSCRIIGLLQTKGQSTMGTDQDDVVVVPIKMVQRRFTGSEDISLIQVSVKDGVPTEQIKAEIETLMRKRRHLSGDQENNFNVMDMKEITNMLTGTTKMMTGLLGAVAAVSLLVGGIGIMNIMLVSVTERTREIGIRLAIGAFEREVMMQFLVESVVLSSFGGLFGIILALAASFGLSIVLKVPFILDGGIILLAFVFSAAVGVVFGYFPALKAARLDPIEALRYE
jgi:putative ABC transport system permease protein